MYIPLCPGTSFVIYDEDTQQALLCTGDYSSGAYEILGPVRNGVSLGDLNGNNVKVSSDGALKVADFGSRPIVGTDAAGADTYTTVLTTGKVCRYLSATCLTNPAVISIDGGSTDGFGLAAGTTPVFGGLEIPAGTAIQARNLSAGNNYASLYISVW